MIGKCIFMLNLLEFSQMCGASLLIYNVRVYARVKAQDGRGPLLLLCGQKTISSSLSSWKGLSTCSGKPQKISTEYFDFSVALAPQGNWMKGK